MSEQILRTVRARLIYTEANHPSPIYHVDGDIQANPYGDLAALFEDDALEEVMYNGDAVRQSGAQESRHVQNQHLD